MPPTAVPVPSDPPRNAAAADALAAPPPFDWRHLLFHGAQVVLANTAIAALVATLNGHPFGSSLVYAQCIGMSIWAIVEGGRLLLPSRATGWPAGWRGLALIGAACTLGYAIGLTVADTIYGHSNWPAYLGKPSRLLLDFGPAVVFCAIVAGWFYARGQARAHRAQIATAAHEATLARLNLLQSQLEPHMLFNTLANLRALIETDPQRAQQMLDHLIAFLRGTLDASRQAEHPLGEEFARIDDYLALMKVRMGDRLRAGTMLPPDLAAIPVPPLLLQPLVENAIKHGLEPQRGPGDLHVSATLEGTTLILLVADSGRGLEAAAAAQAREPVGTGSGFGVAQVRERLQTLHGDAARFTLSPCAGGGTLAEIRLPIAMPAHS
jgi:hypothetical protein